MSSIFVINEQTRISYAGLFLLSHMQSEQADYLVELRNDEKILEPIFQWLLKQEYVEINEQNCYSPTSKGQMILGKFNGRYQNFLDEYDVYCAVDLESGEFAFSQYNQFDDGDDWQNYLNQERWEDLRLAVAESKQIDPIEIVMMTLIRDDAFGFDSEGWKYDLLLGAIWDEIASSYSTALKFKSLSYIDGDEIVSEQSVMKDILEQGSAVMRELK